LEIYLEVDAECANSTECWKKSENFNLALINQHDEELTIRKGIFVIWILH